MSRYFWIFLPALLMCVSCSKKQDMESDILLRYGDETLTYSEVMEMLPSGLGQQDSMVLFNSIIEGWIKDVVLSDFANDRLPDLNSIERRVKDYRNSLIVKEYLSRMRETVKPQIEEQKIRDYYNNHRHEMKLEVPLVKGIFLKVNSDAKGRENIKELLVSDNPEMIDRLERDWLDRSIAYNYFRDKWIDWETITGMIPYRFGNPDEFIDNNIYLETEAGDCAYYLRITDFLHSGEEQPYEFASIWIQDLLTQSDLNAYERSLVESIVEKSIKDKKLEVFGYDPIRHELKENNVNQKDEHQK